MSEAAVSAPPKERGMPYSVHLPPDGGLSKSLRPAQLAEALRTGGPLWVDIDATDRAQHALLEKVFGFHPLAIEDTLSPRTRVKIEEYPGYLFMVIREVRFDQKTDDPYDLETFNLYLFLGSNYLVTVHSMPAHAVQTVQDRIERSSDLVGRGVEMLAHGVIDTVVDEFLPMVDRVDDMVDELEQRLFQRFDDAALQEIFQLKRLVVSLRRYLGPLREVLNILTNRPHSCIAPQAQVYFRDVYDHTIRIVESLESVRDLVATVLETYLSQASNRMNRQMKSLSVVTTIALPLVAISGFFGMNFTHIPMAANPLGFFVAIGAMFVFAGLLYWFLKWQEWV